MFTKKLKVAFSKFNKHETIHDRVLMTKVRPRAKNQSLKRKGSQKFLDYRDKTTTKTVAS